MMPEISLKPLSAKFRLQSDPTAICIETSDGAGTCLRDKDVRNKDLASIERLMMMLFHSGPLAVKKIETDYGFKISDVYYGQASWEADEIMLGLGLQFSPSAQKTGYFLETDHAKSKELSTAVKGIAALKTMAKEGLVYVDHRVHANMSGSWTESNPALKKGQVITKEDLENTWKKEKTVGVYATGTSFQHDLENAIKGLEDRGFVYDSSRNVFEKK